MTFRRFINPKKIVLYIFLPVFLSFALPPAVSSARPVEENEDAPVTTTTTTDTDTSTSGPAGACSPGNFFSFPTWYKYLAASGKMEYNDATKRCEVISYGEGKFEVQDLGLVALALVDIAFRIASIAAVGYVIYGGVQFVIAQGEADKTRKARQTIINAIIGLVIVLISIGLVGFIGGRIGAGVN